METEIEYRGYIITVERPTIDCSDSVRVSVSGKNEEEIYGPLFERDSSDEEVIKPAKEAIDNHILEMQKFYLEVYTKDYASNYEKQYIWNINEPALFSVYNVISISTPSEKVTEEIINLFYGAHVTTPYRPDHIIYTIPVFKLRNKPYARQTWFGDIAKTILMAILERQKGVGK